MLQIWLNIRLYSCTKWPTCSGPWTKQSQRKLGFSPCTVRFINGHVWCCGYDDGIAIYKEGLQTPCRRIKRRELSAVRDVAQMSNGDVIAASNSGLHHLSPTGKSVVFS